MGKIVFAGGPVDKKSEIILMKSYRERIEYLENLLSIRMSIVDENLCLDSSGGIMIDEELTFLSVFNNEEVAGCLK